MPTQENRTFELSATYLEFIISTQTMTPVEFSDKEMTTCHENTRLQNGVFWNEKLFCSSNKRYGEEEYKILFIMAKFKVEISRRLRNIAISLTGRTIVRIPILILPSSPHFYRM